MVGIGPGGLEYLCGRAVEVLNSVTVVAGYTTYIDLIRPLIEGKRVVSTGMKKEVERVEAAIDIARGGESCAIVSSGDPGIYAMAGLALEMCRQKGIRLFPHQRSVLEFFTKSAGIAPSSSANKEELAVEVVPGIPALAAGASLLGAPLTHDFAAVSLSDLLTPWETIEKRVEAAAAADFVIAIYNPKSKKRSGHLTAAQKIILKYRDPKTPVGIVTGAMRDNQQVHITTLADLHHAPVDMQTTVFVGNSNTFEYLDFMVTPRGYSKKYDLETDHRKS
ncbi:MAG: precorrin-3B C(17)-methyltransferase [Thermodesulfobacteriota bacterium]